MENLVQEKSYSFVKNKIVTISKRGKSTVLAFYFWMQNNMVYNERYYKKFQDLLSNIGGLGSFILLIGFFINSFFSSYIVLLDTQNLIFCIEALNFAEGNQTKKPITFLKEKETEMIFQIKNNKNNINNTLQNSKYPLFINDKTENEKVLNHLIYL